MLPHGPPVDSAWLLCLNAPLSIHPIFSQSELEEEREVIEQVNSDKDLAKIVRKGSMGLEELQQITGGSRVPAEALARKSPSAAAVGCK